MLRKLPLRRRVWLFLLALLTLGGMCWADTFDLSDDIPLSQNTVEQALQPEEVTEQVLLLLELRAQAVRVVAPVPPGAHTLPVFGGILSPVQAELRLMQGVRHSRTASF